VIGGETLRVKTAQVSVEHQRETSRLGRLRDSESKALNRVQSREVRFWQEVSHASATRSDSRRGHGGHSAITITRALEAHRLLKKAKDEHSGLVGEVRQQVAKVLKVKVALDAFAKMQRGERVQREYRMAERIGEELTEMQTSLRLRQVGLTRQRYAQAHDESREGRSDGLVVSPPSPGIDTQMKDGQRPPPMLPIAQAKPVEPPTLLAASVALQSINIETSERGTTLQVQVHSSGAPVACHLAAHPEGQVGVVVEVPTGMLLKRLERERAGLVVRLSELGIKIASVEVRRESGLAHSGGGFLRRGRRTQEERDENTIA